jgi:DMSO reductase anchor subunit
VVLLAAVWQVGVANIRHHRFPRPEGVGGLTAREHRLTLSVRVVGTLIGAALLFTAAWWGSSALGSRLSRMPSFLVAFVLLLASELIGRWRFYASHRRLGL